MLKTKLFIVACSFGVAPDLLVDTKILDLPKVALAGLISLLRVYFTSKVHYLFLCHASKMHRIKGNRLEFLLSENTFKYHIRYHHSNREVITSHLAGNCWQLDE